MKVRVSVIFAFLLCLNILSASPLPDVEYLNHSKLYDENNYLVINSPEIKGWTCFYKSKSGIFKPNTEYTISYTLKSDFIEVGGGIHAIARRSDNTFAKDLFGYTEYPNKNGKKCIIKFKTPNIDVSNYSLQFHWYRKTNCQIYDFEIKEKWDSVKFVGNSNKSKIKKFSKPKGAKEFEVSLPDNPEGKIVNALDFGIKPNAKNIPALLNKAIKHCKKINASKLILEKGTYYITEDETITLSKLKDFILDFNGSSFIYYKKSGKYFKIEDCQRTVLKNLDIDWDWNAYPLASIGEVVNISRDAENPFVDFKFYRYEKHPRYKQYLRTAMITPFDKKNKKLGYYNSHALISVDQVTHRKDWLKCEWLTPNTVRISGERHHMTAGLKIGDVCRIQHYYYEMGVFQLISNQHLTIENVNIYSAVGMGMGVIGESKYLYLKNFKIRPPSDDIEMRPITLTADHFHVVNSKGYIKIEDSEFSFGADDYINLHDCGFPIVKLSNRKIKAITNSPQRYRTKLNDTLELRQANLSKTGVSAKILSIANDKDGKWIMELDKDIPEMEEECLVAFNKNFGTDNIIIRNTSFHDGSSNGILIQCNDVTIENCRFYNTLQRTFHFKSGYTFDKWSEGYGVNNVVIRNCEIDGSNLIEQNTGASIFETLVFLRSDPSKTKTEADVLSDILIENCKFSGINGGIAEISSTKRLTMKNNVFDFSKSSNQNRTRFGGISICHSEKIDIRNNIFKGLNDYSKIGIYIENPQTVSDINFANNKFE